MRITIVIVILFLASEFSYAQTGVIKFSSNYNNNGENTRLAIRRTNRNSSLVDKTTSNLTDNVDHCEGRTKKPGAEDSIVIFIETNPAFVDGVATLTPAELSAYTIGDKIYVRCWTEWESIIGDGNNDNACPQAYTGAGWQFNADTGEYADCLSSGRFMEIVAP